VLTPLPLLSGARDLLLAEFSKNHMMSAMFRFPAVILTQVQRSIFLSLLPLEVFCVSLQWTLLSDKLPAIVMIYLLMWFKVLKQALHSEVVLSWSTDISIGTLNSRVNACVENTLQMHRHCGGREASPKDWQNVY
jgi:hypothetical protein